MQNSELFRRGIVVPLDREAADDLAVQDVDESTRVHLLAIEASEFSLLWSTGFFLEINKTTASRIDDYEEHVISPELVPRVRAVALRFAGKRNASDGANRFFMAVVTACDIATEQHMSMYFIL